MLDKNITFLQYSSRDISDILQENWCKRDVTLFAQEITMIYNYFCSCINFEIISFEA